MTKHYSGRDVEIISPSRPVTVTPRSSNALAMPTPMPNRERPGGLLTSIPQRWRANSDTDTYGALTRRSNAERGLVEADTALGKALIDNRRVRQEYSELPEILSADRSMRQLKRGEEIRDLTHQIELAEARRLQDRCRAEAALHAARDVLLDAEQQSEALRLYGPRCHALQWEHRINDWELQVETQRVVLGEHRRRNGRDDLSVDDLYAARDELNAAGTDTTPIDLAIARELVRQQKGRRG